MKELKNDLLTTKYTQVLVEEGFKFNAPHLFHVQTTHNENTEELLASIRFQEGPIKEAGVNGVMNEDLIAMVICRLEHFQASEFKCRENAVAITKLEEALLWLRKRTMGRETRGVEGTHIV
jgi:glutamyl/glutaminyl-tRNA synthetase